MPIVTEKREIETSMLECDRCGKAHNEARIIVMDGKPRILCEDCYTLIGLWSIKPAREPENPVLAQVEGELDQEARANEEAEIKAAMVRGSGTKPKAKEKAKSEDTHKSWQSFNAQEREQYRKAKAQAEEEDKARPKKERLGYEGIKARAYELMAQMGKEETDKTPSKKANGNGKAIPPKGKRLVYE